MLETIKSIILDFQETNLETGIPRRLQIETVRGKAAICIGQFRTSLGKPRFHGVEAALPRYLLLQD